MTFDIENGKLVEEKPADFVVPVNGKREVKNAG